MYQLLIIAVFFIATQVSEAQNPLPDVPTAFSTVSARPQVFYLAGHHIKIPSGGHLQGIQTLRDSQFAITGSSGTYSYYLIANEHQITSIHKISDSPYRHAGGCQVFDGKLYVGIEDNHAKDKSEMVMVSIDDAGQLSTPRIIAHRSGSYKRSTAGAVGATRTTSGQYLLAVGDWDSRNIDFYLSRRASDTLFDSLTTFRVPDQQKWYSYQTINLLADTAGHIYMIALGLDGAKNRADLFEVALRPGMVDLKLLATKFFKCKGASFRYSSGIDVSQGRLVIYSNGMHVKSHMAVNVFR